MHKKILFVGIIFLLVACLPVPQSYAMSLGSKQSSYQVAMHTFGFRDEATGVKLDVAVWYPGQTQTRMTEYDGWVVQSCSHRQSIPKVTPGFYPTVLISHDTASSYFANNDIAAALASKGFFVIVPAHAGDTSNNGDAIYQASLLYRRPLQLLKALELVLSSPDFAPFVDESRIGLLGVGFGAATAAQLSGLEPRADLFTQYCIDNNLYDLRCAGWTKKLLQKFTQDYQEIKKEKGPYAFTPPLTTFAPQALEEVAIPTEDPLELPLSAKENEEDANKHQSFKDTIQSLFGLKKTAETPPLPSQAEEPVAKPLFDFQGGLLYGSTLLGNTFVLFTPTEGNPWIYQVETKPITEDINFTHKRAQKTDVRPYRRPAERRSINAIAFLSPMGAPLFDHQLPNTALPALSILPEYSFLYPHTFQADPFQLLFPAYHEVVVIPKAEHFALFASCTEQAQSFLPETCGNLFGEDKERADTQKIKTLLHFFKQYLGEPLPPQAPTGLKAVHE